MAIGNPGEACAAPEICEARNTAELGKRGGQCNGVENQASGHFEWVAMTGEVDPRSPQREHRHEVRQLLDLVGVGLDLQLRETPLHQSKDGDLGRYARVAVIHSQLRSTWNAAIPAESGPRDGRKRSPWNVSQAPGDSAL